MAEKVTGAIVTLSNKKGSTSRIPLQGEDFTTNTAVVVKYPYNSASPTFQWEGKLKKVSKNKKSAEADVDQLKDVKEIDKRDTTGDVSITIGATTVRVMADIYDE